MKKTLGIILALGLLILPSCQMTTVKNANEPFGGGAVYKELAVGDIAPDFSGTLLSGETFSLEEVSEKVVLINFWATWCSPCMAEMPDIQTLRESYAEDEVEVLLVNVGEDEEQVRDFIEQEGYTFNVLPDPEKSVFKMYPSDGIPYTVVLNRDKTISFIQMGSKSGQDMFKLFSAAVDKALAEE